MSPWVSSNKNHDNNMKEKECKIGTKVWYYPDQFHHTDKDERIAGVVYQKDYICGVPCVCISTPYARNLMDVPDWISISHLELREDTGIIPTFKVGDAIRKKNDPKGIIRIVESLFENVMYITGRDSYSFGVEVSEQDQWEPVPENEKTVMFSLSVTKHYTPDEIKTFARENGIAGENIETILKRMVINDALKDIKKDACKIDVFSSVDNHREILFKQRYNSI